MYQVLARKWRPQNFQELIGQHHVVKALENSLIQKRLHHAYLLTGTRGVGKTTIARILAKCLNCLAYDDVTAQPCCKCDICREIENGNFPDLIEVDGASKTKVEDTRDLLDNVQYLPVVGRYKVYLIDEVHMLSGHSFNALLKTLEEPPQHVKFVLATTDPQKIPVTILSRCLQFSLKKLSPDFIQQQLSKILSHENIQHEENALYRLALLADGSMRDALSLLDQAIAYGSGKVLFDDVAEMLGIIDKSYICQFLEFLCNQDASSMLALVADLEALAKDFMAIIEELLQCLHQLAIIKLIPHDLEKFSWDNKDKLHELAQKFTAEEIQLYYQMALLGKRDLPLAPSHKTGFEMLMLRMLAFHPLQLSLYENVKTANKVSMSHVKTASVDVLQNNHAHLKINNVNNANNQSKASVTINLVSVKETSVKETSAKEISVKETLANINDESKSSVSIASSNSSIANNENNAINVKSATMSTGSTGSLPDDINVILANFNFTGMSQVLMKNCVVAEVGENYIAFNVTKNSYAMLTNDVRERIANIFSQSMGRKISVDFRTVENNAIETPASLQEKQIKQEQETKRMTILNDPAIQNIINTFDGELVNFKENNS